MSAEIGLIQLQDICIKVCSGGTPSTRNKDFYIGGVIPWVKTKEVNNNKIVRAETYITEEALAKSSAKLIPENSVIVAMYGNGDTAGRVAINKIPVSTNQACCNLIIDPEKADYRFVFFYLRTQYQRLVDLKNGGAQQNLNAGMLKEYPFPNFPLDKQVEIADVLEGFDEKIELNRQTNQTLEHIAQAIFKSWFVDFEPTRAKIAAKEEWAKKSLTAKDGGNDDSLPTEQAEAIFVERAAMAAISGKSLEEIDQLAQEYDVHDCKDAGGRATQGSVAEGGTNIASARATYEQLKTTAALFPDAMVDSEKGEVPKGWEISNINDISSHVAMGPFGSDIKVDTFVDSGIPIINGQQLKNTMLKDGENKFITEEHADRLIKSNVYRGDIIITHRGTLGQVSIIPEKSAYERYIVSQSQCYIRPDTRKISPLYLIYFFRSYIGQYELLSYESQVGVPAIAKPVTNLRKIELLLPDKDVLDQFQVLVGQLQLSISNTLMETASLESTRDTLLPKLLSGEIASA